MMPNIRKLTGLGEYSNIEQKGCATYIAEMHICAPLPNAVAGCTRLEAHSLIHPTSTPHTHVRAMSSLKRTHTIAAMANPTVDQESKKAKAAESTEHPTAAAVAKPIQSEHKSAEKPIDEDDSDDEENEEVKKAGQGAAASIKKAIVDCLLTDQTAKASVAEAGREAGASIKKAIVIASDAAGSPQGGEAQKKKLTFAQSHGPTRFARIMARSSDPCCSLCPRRIDRKTAQPEAVAHRLCDSCFWLEQCTKCDKQFSDELIGDGEMCGFCTAAESSASGSREALTLAFAELAKGMHDTAMKVCAKEPRLAEAMAFILHDLANGSSLKICRGCKEFKGVLHEKMNGLCEPCSEARMVDTRANKRYGPCRRNVDPSEVSMEDDEAMSDEEDDDGEDEEEEDEEEENVEEDEEKAQKTKKESKSDCSDEDSDSDDEESKKIKKKLGLYKFAKEADKLFNSKEIKSVGELKRKLDDLSKANEKTKESKVEERGPSDEE